MWEYTIYCVNYLLILIQFILVITVITVITVIMAIYARMANTLFPDAVPAAMMATPGQMPMRNERSVPLFDPTRPRELVHYLEDLEDHFAWCTIGDLVDRKK
jgi:hypothetical protein